jgi:hypothetical protein
VARLGEGLRDGETLGLRDGLVRDGVARLGEGLRDGAPQVGVGLVRVGVARLGAGLRDGVPKLGWALVRVGAVAASREGRAVGCPQLGARVGSREGTRKLVSGLCSNVTGVRVRDGRDGGSITVMRWPPAVV